MQISPISHLSEYKRNETLVNNKTELNFKGYLESNHLKVTQKNSLATKFFNKLKKFFTMKNNISETPSSKINTLQKDNELLDSLSNKNTNKSESIGKENLLTKSQKPKETILGHKKVYKYTNGNIKKIEEDWFQSVTAETRELTNYRDYNANYSCFEYYKDGTIKEFAIIGTNQRCYGSFYRNGKIKKSLEFDIKREYNGSRGYDEVITGELKEYSANGDLIKTLKTSTNENFYSAEYLQYKFNGATYFDNKEITEHEKNISNQLLNKLISKNEFKKQYPNILGIEIKPLTLNTWVLPDDSIIIDHNGMYSRLTPDATDLYNRDFNIIKHFDIINGERILK